MNSRYFKLRKLISDLQIDRGRKFTYENVLCLIKLNTFQSSNIRTPASNKQIHFSCWQFFPCSKSAVLFELFKQAITRYLHLDDITR